MTLYQLQIFRIVAGWLNPREAGQQLRIAHPSFLVLKPTRSNPDNAKMCWTAGEL
jgi:hypothetical protein